MKSLITIQGDLQKFRYAKKFECQKHNIKNHNKHRLIWNSSDAPRKTDRLYFILKERHSDEFESRTNISSGRVFLSLTEFFSTLNFSLMTYNKTFCRGKAISITYSEGVSVALVILSSIKGAAAVLYCHLSSVRLCHIFPHYPINGTTF
jgi:hypothetical protein